MIRLLLFKHSGKLIASIVNIAFSIALFLTYTAGMVFSETSTNNFTTTSLIFLGFITTFFGLYFIAIDNRSEAIMGSVASIGFMLVLSLIMFTLGNGLNLWFLNIIIGILSAVYFLFFIYFFFITKEKNAGK